MSDIHDMTWPCPKCHKQYIHWDGRAKTLWCLGLDCHHKIEVPGANVRPFVEPTPAQIREAIYGKPETPEDIAEELGMEMHEIKNDFWLAFSKLCNDTLDKLSNQEHRWELEMQLGESTSIYGRDTGIRSDPDANIS